MTTPEQYPILSSIKATTVRVSDVTLTWSPSTMDRDQAGVVAGSELQAEIRALLREREEILKRRPNLKLAFDRAEAAEAKLAGAQREIERIRSAYERSHSAQEYDRAQARVAEQADTIERLKALPGTAPFETASELAVEVEHLRNKLSAVMAKRGEAEARVAELEAQLQAEREQLAAEQRRADRISRILSEARSRLCLPSGEIAKVPDEISRWAIGKGELQDRLAAEIEARKRAEGQLARSLVPVKRLEEMLQAAEEKLRRLREAAEFACEEHEKECGTQCAGCSGMVELRAALLADQTEGKP